MAKDENIPVLHDRTYRVVHASSWRYLTEGQDFQKYRTTDAIQGFDLSHQLSRLRLARNLTDSETELIVRTVADNVRSYEQVVEVCCLCVWWKICKEIYLASSYSYWHTCPLMLEDYCLSAFAYSINTSPYEKRPWTFSTS